VVPLAQVRDAVQRRFAALNGDGYRVLGVASKPMPGRGRVTLDDEIDMTLEGLLAFHDPARPDAADAVQDLARLDISVRLVTGDNRLAAANIAAKVGLGDVMTGGQIDRLDDDTLAGQMAQTQIFAEVEPLHKERIVRALRAGGAVVGFLGDGINDAPALHAADVGISVDTAADIAKQSASIVLMDKGLHVAADGVRLGWQIFANTLKYVQVTVSANFATCSAWPRRRRSCPSCRCCPARFCCSTSSATYLATTIATDAVDHEQLRTPRRWDIAAIRRFMITFGLLSSFFDVATFLVLRLGFDASADVFRTGWFIESTATELAVMLVLRTARPFFRSRPSRALLLSTAIVAACTLIMPYLPFLAEPLGLTPLPLSILAALAALTALYVLATSSPNGLSASSWPEPRCLPRVRHEPLRVASLKKLGEPGLLAVLADDPSDIWVSALGQGPQSRQPAHRLGRHGNAPAVAEALTKRPHARIASLARRSSGQTLSRPVADFDRGRRGLGRPQQARFTDSGGSGSLD
jgi:Mg2+-importing ATPase